MTDNKPETPIGEVEWSTGKPPFHLKRRSADDRADYFQMKLVESMAEVDRLRSRLAELEWTGTRGYVEEEEDACPACWATREEGHLAAGPRTGPDGKSYIYPGCWLAEELSQDEEPYPQEPLA